MTNGLRLVRSVNLELSDADFAYRAFDVVGALYFLGRCMTPKDNREATLRIPKCCYTAPVRKVRTMYGFVVQLVFGTPRIISEIDFVALAVGAARHVGNP